MLRKYGPFGAALLVFFVVFLLTANFVVPSFETCVSQNSSDQSAKESENKAGIVGRFVLAESICSLRLVDRHNGFFAAVAAFVIAAFTATLWWSTQGMLAATNKTIKLARNEFISTHRPRLRVKNVVIDRPPKGEPLFKTGRVISGQLDIINIGVNRALYHDGHCSVFCTREGLPMQRPFSEEQVNLRPDKTTLWSGESVTVTFRSAATAPEHIENAGSRVIHGWDVYVMGWVTYIDDATAVRRTGFCRKFKASHFGEGRFRAVKNPDYEYED